MIDPEKIAEWKRDAERDVIPGCDAPVIVLPLLSEREEMLAAIRVVSDRLEEVTVALSGVDREHAAQVLRTTERARAAIAPFLR